MALALIAITGICAVVESAANICMASIPLMPGRLMSISITSGSNKRAISTPLVPLPALNKEMSGRRSSSFSTNNKFAGLSSTYSKVDCPSLGEIALLINACSVLCVSNSGSLVRINSIQNTLPTPTVLCTPISPSINSTKRLLTTKPMPVPSLRPASWPSRLKG